MKALDLVSTVVHLVVLLAITLQNVRLRRLAKAQLQELKESRERERGLAMCLMGVAEGRIAVRKLEGVGEATPQAPRPSHLRVVDEDFVPPGVPCPPANIRLEE